MTAASAENIIALSKLIEYNKTGLKLIPLAEDGMTPTIKSTNDVYYNTHYWTDEKIEQEHYSFHNVATTFGKTHIKDEKGNELYLNQLDIDSKEALDRLAIIRAKDKEHFFIDEMSKLTFVVKTRKNYGYHIYWLSHKQLKPIATNNCKLNNEFEIKTDNSSGVATLPPSRHRDDLNFHYQSIGQNSIAISDDMYDGISKLLADCLKKKRR